MIFTKLQIQNFGLFCGAHEFDLKPREKYGKTRPIILFGGKNGSGKTTIMEAILLCLYGKSSVGERVGEREYKEYLAGRIHRPRGGDVILLTSAHIQLEFSHTHFGDERSYTAKRAWTKRGAGVDEELTLLCNGEAFDRIEANLAQDFLKELIPIGVSKLFFFDGEKIQELASDGESGSALGSSIKAMLNLDVVERLQTDLRIHLNRQKRDGQLDDVRRDLKMQEKSQQALDDRRSVVKQELASVETRLEQKRSEVEKEEATFRTEGGAYAKELTSLKQREARLMGEAESLEGRMRELCAGLLPFAILPELCESLTGQLEAEQLLRQWKTGEAVVRQAVGTMQAMLREQFELDSTRSAELVDAIIGSIQPPSVQETTHLIHEDLSDRDAGRISDWLGTGITATELQFRELCVDAERTTRDLREVLQQVNKAPEEDVAARRIGEIKRLTHAQGELSREKEQKQKELKSIEYEYSEMRRSYQKALDMMTDSEDMVDRTELAGKVQRVLDRFLGQLSKSKVEQLESTVASAFATLHRKGDMIRGMRVDPETYVVTLLGRGHRPIAKKELSAGEKQIYAIAILWALAQISGRPLPVVIDTPLGRLDSDHRRNLVESYFPRASHQVIILSTDTEVDSKYYKDLSRHVSHAYHLEYNPMKMETEAKEGYFWKSHREETEETKDEAEQGQRLLRSVGAA